MDVKPSDDCDECRRRLILGGVGTLMMAGLPECGEGAPAAPAATTPERTADAEAPVDAGCPPMCADGESMVAIRFGEHPELESVGGSVVVSAAGFKDVHCGKDKVLVFQPSPGTFLALSASCTHQCCTVRYDAANDEVVCPCHGSRYDTDGTVIHGPAAHSLQQLSVCADDCGVMVMMP
jgi:Rieske Fe-S protein